MHMMPAAAGLPSCSTDRIVADCGHAFTAGPDGAAGYDTMTLLRSMASDVVKFCAAEVAPTIELAASSAVARHQRGALIGRSEVGMKPVSLTPSFTVAVMSSGLNVEEVATSNLYVIAPAGPVRVALRTRKVGLAPVCAPLSGAIGTGASIRIAGPTVNFLAAVNGPTVPPACARACQ